VLPILDEALTFVEKNNEHLWEGEIYRLKGELTLQSQIESHKLKESRVGIAHQEAGIAEAETVGGAHSTEEAQACFLKAIEVARQQRAKSWELRATTSLARLWQRLVHLQETFWE
jgi:hypothetical protein